MKNAFAKFFALFALLDIRDVFCFGGLSMVGYGVHQIYSPAAWIVVGVVLYWIGIRNGHSRNP